MKHTKYYYRIGCLNGYHVNYGTPQVYRPSTYWSDTPLDFRAGRSGAEVQSFKDCHLLGIL